MDSKMITRNRLILISLIVASCLIMLFIVYLKGQGVQPTNTKDLQSGSDYNEPHPLSAAESTVAAPESVSKPTRIEMQPPPKESLVRSISDRDLELIDNEVYAQGEEALGRALFDAKYSDPRNFVQLKWYSGMSYKTARRLIKKKNLTLLHEMLDDKSYAPYWHQVALLIGYVSEDPNSVPVLLHYFQRDDSWNWKSVDRRPTGYQKIIGKISSLMWIGKIGGDEANVILRDAVTKQGAARLANAWIEGKLLPNSSTFKSRENTIMVIRARAAKGLAYSGKPENIAIVKQLYAQEDAYCIKNKKVTTLYNGLVDAMAIQAFIAENRRENLLNTLGTINYLEVLGPYIDKYAWHLKDLNKQ